MPIGLGGDLSVVAYVSWRSNSVGKIPFSVNTNYCPYGDSSPLILVDCRCRLGKFLFYCASAVQIEWYLTYPNKSERKLLKWCIYFVTVGLNCCAFSCLFVVISEPPEGPPCLDKIAVNIQIMTRMRFLELSNCQFPNLFKLVPSCSRLNTWN
jgi:hypothetical protein